MIDRSLSNEYSDKMEPSAELRCPSLLLSYGRRILDRGKQRTMESIRKSPVFDGTCGLVWAKLYDARYEYLTGDRGVATAALFEVYRSALEELNHISSHRGTLLKGSAGPLVICISVCVLVGDASNANRHCDELLNLSRSWLSLLPHNACEVLYGRCGYLQAILAARHALAWSCPLIGPLLPSPADFGKDIVSSVIRDIYKEGCLNSKSEGQSLMWHWHGKKYLGACHGVAGILYTLSLFPEHYHDRSLFSGELKRQYPNLTVDSIAHTMHEIMDHHFRSDNKPCCSSKSDELVQWCHGGVGVVYLICSMLQTGEMTASKERYIEVALKICNCMWENGQQRPGFSLVQGLPGHGYASLALSRVLQNLVDSQKIETRYLIFSIRLKWRAFYFGDALTKVLTKSLDSTLFDSKHADPQEAEGLMNMALHTGSTGVACFLFSLAFMQDDRIPNGGWMGATSYPCYDLLY